MQHSFLDAFLKGHDPLGWSRDEQPKVGYKVRVGDVGFNDAAAENAYPERYAEDWPIRKTKYTHYYLTPSQDLVDSAPAVEDSKLSYDALGDLKNQHLIQFTSEPFKQETELTGHLVAHLNVSVTAAEGSTQQPSDIDLFITIRHLNPEGKEVLYTGTVGDPVPVTKGWLRVSLRKVNEESPRHQSWHPHREYLSTDRAPLHPGEVYPVDVEIWPTNVVISPGDRLVLEVSSGDTQGAGLFEHNSKEDRDEATFGGVNHVHFGKEYDNWLLMPLIPAGKTSE